MGYKSESFNFEILIVDLCNKPSQGHTVYDESLVLQSGIYDPNGELFGYLSHMVDT